MNDKLHIFDKVDKDITDIDMLGVEEVLEDYDEDKEPSLSSGESSFDPSLQFLELKPPESIVDGKSLYCARTFNEFLAYVEKYVTKDKLKISYDIETNAEDPLYDRAEIIGFSIASSKDEGVYVLRESLDYKMPDDDWYKITSKLIDIFKEVDKVVVHNCKYEVPYTENKLNYQLTNDKVEDTMIKHRVTYPGEPAGLKPASARHLGYSDWDSILGIYTSNSKKIINYISWVKNTKRKRNYTDFDEKVYNYLFLEDRYTNPQDLYNNLYNDAIARNDDGEVPVSNSLIMSMVAILQVLVSAESYTEEILTLFIKEVLRLGEVGLSTRVIPYSLIPSKVISKYGALDSISTYELDDFLNESMKTKSKEINDMIDDVSLHINLEEGYYNVKSQYFASIVLEMSGAYWNDTVAEGEYEWYNSTAISSWRKIVNNPLMIDKVVDYNFNLYKDILIESLSRIYNEEQLSELDTKLLDFLKSKGSYKLSRTRLTFYDIIDETKIDKRTGQVKPLGLSHTKLLNSVFKDELTNIFKDEIVEYVKSRLNSEVKSYKELKDYLNLGSTGDTIHEMVDSILNNNQMKLAMLYNWCDMNIHNDRYWEYEDKTVKPGLEFTSRMYSFLDTANNLKKDNKITQSQIFTKFCNIVESLSANLVNDFKFMNKLSEINDYKIASLAEGDMISMYNRFVDMGVDVEDESTWSLEFDWLYNFRLYKKCVKMITSYIQGSVGRSSVTIIPRETCNKLLPIRSRKYYDNYDEDTGLTKYEGNESCLLTMPWHACSAETGRWRSALHCLPYDVEVLTESGYIPIGTLVDTNAVGKQVYTISSKGKFILKPIKEVHISGTSDRMVKLYLSNGKTVECTYNHRFLTVNGIYKMAKELEGCNLVGHSITSFRVVGSNLELTHTRPWVRVLSVDYLEGSQDVYELTIDEETPCFILGCGLISHNTIPTGSSIKNIFTSRYLGGSIMAPDYCLSGDTLVKLTNGEDVKIEDLVGRDEFYVYSYDENKREVVVGRGHDCRPVVKPESMLKLTLDTGEIIKCTREHQFYLYAIGFTESRYLKVGSQLKSIKGFSEITEIEEIEGEQTYCFTVDEFHNFYLTSKVLSHNSQME